MERCGFSRPPSLRLWSLHPSLLDTKGLVALWREGLLAQKVLQGRTKGFRQHPQLLRFQNSPQPLASIGSYLLEVAKEAARRGYRFQSSKIARGRVRGYKIALRSGQRDYEWKHLLAKLRKRDPGRFETLKELSAPRVHPLFRLRPGGIEAWEKVS